VINDHVHAQEVILYWNKCCEYMYQEQCSWVILCINLHPFGVK